MTLNKTKFWIISFCLNFQKVLLEGNQTIEIEVPPPDPTKIPDQSDILGVTLLMITALYRRQEFFRCSYFVYNNYEDQTMMSNSESVKFEHVLRSILFDKPRVRVYEIMWDHTAAIQMGRETSAQTIRPQANCRKEQKKNGGEHRKQKISKKKQ